MDYTELADLYSRNMYGGGDFDTYHGEAEQYGGGRRKKVYDPEAFDKQFGAGRRKKVYDPEAFDKQFGAGRRGKVYDPEAFDKQFGAGHDEYDDQFGAGYGYEQFGGADFTEAECRQWLADNFTNPKTGRKIGPTKSGTGVFYDLQKACLGYASTSRAATTSSSTASRASTSSSAYVMQTPPPIVAQPLKKTTTGEEIVRTTAGRKGPSASATSLPVGTQRVGGDGQMYIVKLRANSTQYWQPCSQSTANC